MNDIEGDRLDGVLVEMAQMKMAIEFLVERVAVLEAHSVLNHQARLEVLSCVEREKMDEALRCGIEICTDYYRDMTLGNN